MEYMTEEDVLPVPLNIVRLPRAIFEWIFDCWDKDEENLKIPVEMNGTTLNDMPVTRNGTDVSTCRSILTVNVKSIQLKKITTPMITIYFCG
jgi:hypothetical protein